MVELVLAGVIIGAVMTAAAVTGIRDRRRRKEERAEAERGGMPPFGEPIPSGWMATGGLSGSAGMGDAGGDGGGC
jgi:hypothetical protein